MFEKKDLVTSHSNSKSGHQHFQTVSFPWQLCKYNLLLLTLKQTNKQTTPKNTFGSGKTPEKDIIQNK